LISRLRESRVEKERVRAIPASSNSWCQDPSARLLGAFPAATQRLEKIGKLGRRAGTCGPLPRCDRSARDCGWGDRTSIGVTRQSAWKWPAPAMIPSRAPPYCKWRKCGYAWRPNESSTSRKRIAVSTKRESFPNPPPWRASPRPAPSPPKSCGAARSWPRVPCGGIPRQIAGIGLIFPCLNNQPVNRAVPSA
jgi:hypothetical protein